MVPCCDEPHIKDPTFDLLLTDATDSYPEPTPRVVKCHNCGRFARYDAEGKLAICKSCGPTAVNEATGMWGNMGGDMHRCACGMFAKLISSRYIYNGSHSVLTEEVDCAVCGRQTVRLT